MHAFKIFILISFLCSSYLNGNAGNPLTPVEIKEQRAPEQTYMIKKPLSNSALTTPATKNTSTPHSQLYLPNRPRESSDWVSLRDNVGRIINLVHLVGTGVMDLPHYNYINTGYAPNHQANDLFRKRDMVFVSTLSALCIAGVVLGPVISSKTHNVRYNHYVQSKYVVALSMNNELDLMVKF